ncbi:MAG: phage DNA packaging protein J [Chloroflexaceae bacterium]|nr:phage DNA packaging protein J [Chloroflexaceae bacterium]
MSITSCHGRYHSAARPPRPQPCAGTD